MLKKDDTLVIGNWKMNPGSTAAAKKHAQAVCTRALRARSAHTHVGIAVPTLYIPEVAKVLRGKQVMLGAQNATTGSVGAETGEVSAGMLKEFHTSFAVVGHSERRARGESDTQIASRVQGVLAAGMIPVVCVGEISRDDEGNFYNTVAAQMDAIFRDISARKALSVVVAYEPVWAIGSGSTPEMHNISEMRLFIQKKLSEIYDATTARKVKVLYGGSVTEENAARIMQDGMVDGFLVGGASLDVERFSSIIRAAARS